MVETNFTPPLTILQRAKLHAYLSDTLYAECIEQTLPPNSMYELAKSTAKHANILLDLIEKAQRTAAITNTLREGEGDLGFEYDVLTNTRKIANSAAANGHRIEGGTEATDYALGQGRR